VNKDQLNTEKRAAVQQLATLDKEIEECLAAREDNYKKATKVIKAQIAEFAKPLYEKRREEYHAVTAMKARRADLQKIVSNCDEALLNIEKSEKLAAAAAPPVVAAPVVAPVAAPSPVPVAKKKAKKKSA
jgi:hypothetical protein